jgi:hypothetical protein
VIGASFDEKTPLLPQRSAAAERLSNHNSLVVRVVRAISALSRGGNLENSP